MNWFQKGSVALGFKHLERGVAECCEHVEKDHSCAYSYVQECDAFGHGDGWLSCKDCHDKACEEDRRTCRDCLTEKPGTEVLEWRWYDFYAQQGDVPYQICKTCWDGPKHQERMRQDDYEAEEEFGQRW